MQLVLFYLRFLSRGSVCRMLVALHCLSKIGSGARTNAKRSILLGALLLMAIGVLLFMLVPNYTAMVFARLLQGASGSGVWGM